MKTQASLLLFLLLAGCSGKNSDVRQQGVAHDSLKVADSTGAVTAVQPAILLSYEERQGKNLYDRYCVICHGQEGKGDGFNAFNLEPRPRDFTDSKYMNALGDKQTYETIRGGGRSVNKSALMPSYGWTLKKEELQYVAAYLETFSSGASAGDSGK